MFIMELSEKLQELRKEKGLTQEELAEALFVSRTAISKWESGRGVPNIESLKAISKFFSVSIDELLSGEEILKIADEDNKQKEKHTRDLVFGLLDCSLIMFLFLPFFGQKGDEIIKEVSTTLLVMCVMPTAVMQLNSRIRNTKMKRAFAFALIAFTAFMVIGRLISGVHWITDIIGGAILSAGLVMIYYSVTTLIARQER